MTPAEVTTAVVVAAALGPALLLAGQWWGTRLSRSHVEAADRVLKSCEAVSAMARVTASRAAKDANLSDQLREVRERLAPIEHRLKVIDETETRVWELLKLEVLGQKSARISRSLNSLNNMPRTPMPTIENAGPWGHPEGSDPENGNPPGHHPFAEPIGPAPR